MVASGGVSHGHDTIGIRDLHPGGGRWLDRRRSTPTTPPAVAMYPGQETEV